jgi:SAM-dependent methyltransferase
MSSYSRQQLEAWLKTIDVNGKVIDIGGSQNPVKGRTKTWNAEEYKIFDLKNPHEQKADYDIIMDFNLLAPQLIQEKYTNYFDMAFCLEVSEYWFNPHIAIFDIKKLLKENGILYISFHTLYGLHKPESLDYLRYTKYGIEKLLEENGFKIEEMIPRPITEEGRQALIEFYKVEGMRVLYNKETFKEGYLVKARKI